MAAAKVRQPAEAGGTMGVKLIVCDVDGTLIDHSETVIPELIQIVDQCRKEHIYFSLASGRTKELIEDIRLKLHVTEPYIAANGACLFVDDTCVLMKGFCADPIRDIISDANRAGLTVTCSDAYQERALSVTDYVAEHRKLGNRFKQLLDFHAVDWKEQKFVKIMFMDEHRTGKIERIRKALKPYSSQYWITTYSDVAVELGPVQCNKATGVRELAGLMGIGMEEVMACGDFTNDLEMIREAGIGVAVANANEILKSSADYVATSACACGVIEAVKKFCLSGNGVP